MFPPQTVVIQWNENKPVFLPGLEPRILTRWDMHKYAREAYNAGIHFIGGCCGFEPYHIRAVAEELAPERGFLPAASEKHGNWGAGLEMHTKPWVRARSGQLLSVCRKPSFRNHQSPNRQGFLFISFRARRAYWENLHPASGRPLCPSMSAPDAWGVTKGHSDLVQQKEATTQQQLKDLFERSKRHWAGDLRADINQTAVLWGKRTLHCTVQRAAPNTPDIYVCSVLLTLRGWVLTRVGISSQEFVGWRLGPWYFPWPWTSLLNKMSSNTMWIPWLQWCY